MDLHRARVKVIERIVIAENTGCWDWALKVRPNGYARVTYLRKSMYAHRLSFQAFNGYIDKDLDVCHTCDNRKCVNPAHLFLGTRKENMEDAVKKGRQAKGASIPQTKIHGANLEHVLYLIRAGVKYQAIADKYQVTKSCIGYIARKNNIRRYKV
tara:strand:+ start:34 stop:498 length:465 start_codon:yes stop_codon:yes gene_type:complete